MRRDSLPCGELIYRNKMLASVRRIRKHSVSAEENTTVLNKAETFGTHEYITNSGYRRVVHKITSS
jgi:hypothetical protein